MGNFDGKDTSKETIYKEEYDTEENRKFVSLIKEEFEYEFEKVVACPPSWAKEVYELLNHLRGIVPDLHLRYVQENKGKLIVDYTVGRTSRSYVSMFIEQCIKELVKKGVYPEVSSKTCPHCGGIL